MNEQKNQVIQAIPRTRSVTAKEISHKTGISKPRLHTILKTLVRDGLVDREQVKGHGSPFVYSR